MKLLRWIAALLAALVVVAFAVANREPVVVSFDPLPYVLELPLYALALGALFAGFLLGLFIEWLLGLKARGLARARGRRIAALEAELAGLRRAPAAPAERGGPSLSPPEQAA